MKILMTTSVYPRNEDDGTPPFVRHLAEAIVHAGHEVTIICPHSKGLTHRESYNGVEIIRYTYCFPRKFQTLCYDGGMLVRLKQNKLNYLHLPLFFISQFLSLKRELKQNYDILHAHSILPQGLVAALAKKHKIPLVISSHGNDLYGLKSRFKRSKEKAVQSASTLILNSSFSLQNARIQFPTARLAKIHACPNLIKPEEGLIRKKKILFIGRLINEKGLLHLISALKKFYCLMPDSEWITEIAGEGPLHSTLSNQINDAKLSDRIALKGWIPPEKVSAFLQQGEILVVPSLAISNGWQEAQGLVAIEGMGAGLAVVVAQSGGLAEPIDNGENGLILDRPDTESICENIITLTKNDHLRKSLQANAQAHFNSKYSTSAIAKKTLNLYRSLIKDPQSL